VAWYGGGGQEVSRIRTLGMGGLFISTHNPPPVGARLILVFEVPGGSVQADAVVRSVVFGDQRLFGSKTESITGVQNPHNHARNHAIVPNHWPRKYLKNKGDTDYTEHYECAALTAELAVGILADFALFLRCTTWNDGARLEPIDI